MANVKIRQWFMCKLPCTLEVAWEDPVSLMNKKAQSIGAVNTNFANPHGLHDDSHYSTAYDLALITKKHFLMMNLQICKI